MKKRIFFVLIILLVFCHMSFADILHLKNGKVLRGKIVEEKPYSVKFISNDNLPYFYYRHEISKIIKEDKMVPEEEGVSDEKRELILKLFDTINTQEMVRGVLLKAEKEAPEKIRNDFGRLMDADEIIELLIPLYSQYYTEEELTELIAFFETSIAKKHFKLAPVIAEATIKLILEYIDNKNRNYK